MAKKLKPLPMIDTKARTIKEAKRRVLKLLRLGRCILAFARDSKGASVNYNSPEATKVCLLGAIYRTRSQVLIGPLNRILTTRSLGGFNDRHTLAEVIDLVKRA